MPLSSGLKQTKHGKPRLYEKDSAIEVSNTWEKERSTNFGQLDEHQDAVRASTTIANEYRRHRIQEAKRRDQAARRMQSQYRSGRARTVDLLNIEGMDEEKIARMKRQGVLLGKELSQRRGKMIKSRKGEADLYPLKKVGMVDHNALRAENEELEEPDGTVEYQTKTGDIGQNGSGSCCVII